MSEPDAAVKRLAMEMYSYRMATKPTCRWFAGFMLDGLLPQGMTVADLRDVLKCNHAGSFEFKIAVHLLSILDPGPESTTPQSSGP